ncbi:MAG: LamG domain-containing protein, partial [Patescibacteria group bacterium]|nr:LamG domain-containing protein [Patescibacteria group bacterium]
STGSPLSSLPVDPSNSTSSGNYYYTYTVSSSTGLYELTAVMEAAKDMIGGAAGNDGGWSSLIFEDGTDLSLVPPGVLGRGSTYLSLTKDESALVGYWKFDETGAAASDSSVQGNDGAMYPSDFHISSGCVSGSCADFNGTSDYVYRSTFNNVPGSQMTICGWIILQSTSTEILVQQGRSGSNINGEYEFIVTGQSGSVYMEFWDWDNNYGFNGQASNTAIATGAWHYACFVKDGTAGTYYLDGQPNGSITASLDVVYRAGDFAIGKDYRDNVDYFNGLLDNLRIYNRALSSAEISLIYSAEKP